MKFYILDSTDDGVAIKEFAEEHEVVSYIGARVGHEKYPADIRDFRVIRGEEWKIEPVQVVKSVSIRRVF